MLENVMKMLDTHIDAENEELKKINDQIAQKTEKLVMIKAEKEKMISDLTKDRLELEKLSRRPASELVR